MEHAEIIRPVAALSGPAILLAELVHDEGLDIVVRAIASGLLPIFDTGAALLAQRSTFDVIADGGLLATGRRGEVAR